MTLTFNILYVTEVESGLMQKNRCNITATLGLVVHAAVDGIALGAAATTDHTEVEIIVFLAIMLHKVICFKRCFADDLNIVLLIIFLSTMTGTSCFCSSEFLTPRGIR